MVLLYLIRLLFHGVNNQWCQSEATDNMSGPSKTMGMGLSYIFNLSCLGPISALFSSCKTICVQCWQGTNRDKSFSIKYS